MPEDGSCEQQVAAALTRLAHDLRYWRQRECHEYDGSDWPGFFEDSLRVIRGQFVGSVRAVYELADEVPQPLWAVLEDVNTKVTLVRPIRAGVTYRSAPLDQLIEAMPDLPQRASDIVNEPREYAQVVGDVLDRAAELAAVAEGLSRRAVTCDGQQSEVAPSGGDGATSGDHRREDDPDEDGWVKDPPDPTAYGSAKKVLNDRGTLEAGIRTYSHLNQVLRQHPEIRRIRPGGHSRRLSIHLGDWRGFLDEWRESKADCDPAPDDVAARKGLIDRYRGE